MPDTILGGDLTIYYSADADAGSSQKRMSWTGSSTGKRSLNEAYSALAKLFKDPAQMDDLIPWVAITPDIYRIGNAWFIDDETVQHFTGGSLFSLGWKDGTTENIKLIGYAQTTEFDVTDIGRTFLGGTTGDTGVILDFNTDRKLLWFRPDDPLLGGDDFDNGNEAYTIPNSAFAHVWQVDDTPSDNDFVDETADANSGTDADWLIFTAAEATGDYVALGFRQPFVKVVFDNLNGTQGVGGVVVWEYWDGTAWSLLSDHGSVTDGTSSFTTAVADGQELTFSEPNDWARRTISTSANLYWIRGRITTIFSTNPVYDQGFIGVTGAGIFADHNRHGSGSVGGDSAWPGLSTIGTIQQDTHVYIGQEDPDRINAENLLVDTKGISDWWDDGPLDILIKVKEADSVFGPLPGSSPVTAVATVLAHQYTKTYSHSIATGLTPGGSPTVVSLSTLDDADNPSGHRNLIWDNGDAGVTLLDEELLFNVGTTALGNMVAGVQDNGGVFTDDTTDLNDIGGADVNVYEDPAATEDAFYFGLDNIFRFLLIDVATAHNGTSSTQIWEYWDGSAWQTLTVVDDTDVANGAFDTTGRGLVTWTPPSDWARTNITNQPPASPLNLYYVRIRLAAVGDMTTEPVLHQAWAGGELQLKARVADSALTDSGATGNADYYLLGDPIVDFVDDDVMVALATLAGSRKNADINGGPTPAGPASDTDITFTHGQFTRDINENGTLDPYSIDLNNASSKTMALAYERAKFLTSRQQTATASTDDQEGRFYIGSELQIEYNSQAGGQFAEGRKVYDQTSDAEGIIVADHDDGTDGDLILRTVRGTFVDASVLSDSPDPVQVMDTDSFVFQVEDSPFTVVDESADALSGATGDVDLFPASEAIGDYVIIGAKKPFAKVVFDNTGGTQGVGGIGDWEYWNGTAWVDLETAPGFSDATSDFTAVVGVQDLDFYPPVDWQPRGIGAAAVLSSQALFMIRFIITTVFGTNPLYDTVGVQDFVTATINGIPRTITPIASAPFGTFPGASKFFMAPGLAPTPAEMAGGESQAYSTIDDDGITKAPPNKQTVELTNLIAGDTATIMRRTGLVITKDQFTLAPSTDNQKGDVNIDMTSTIPTSNPNVAGTKVRVISPSGEEHRYRYASFTGVIFTLDAAKTGTADGGSNDTTLEDAAGAFTSAPAVEVGDYIRNTTDDLFRRVTAVVGPTTLTIEAGISFTAADTYEINTLVEDYFGPFAYVPMIERIATSDTEGTTITYSGDIDIRADVRRTDDVAILPYTADSSVVSTGRSLAATRNPDTIIT